MTLQLKLRDSLANGEADELIVTTVTADGTKWSTDRDAKARKIAGQRKLEWGKLDVQARGVTIEKNGMVHMPEDARVMEGRIGHISVVVPGQKGLSAALDVPVRYDGLIQVTYYGSGGRKGYPGRDAVTLSELNKVPASDGGDGSDGAQGPSVEVQLALSPRSGRDGRPVVVQALLKAEGKYRYVEYEPDHGSLWIQSLGGGGGSGGTGGSPAPTGNAGSSSQNGTDGTRGPGGHILIFYDPSVAPYIDTVKLTGDTYPSSNKIERPTEPLW